MAMEAKERKRDEYLLAVAKLKGVHRERFLRLREKYQAESMAEVIRRALQDAEKVASD